MSDQAEDKVPAAEIRPIRRISGLWLIPIITLILAGLMVYDNYRSMGPLVSIAFATASGIEAGVTKIRIRDVEIGEVEEITLNDSLDGVIVSARIHNEYRDLLVEDSRFWVVQPTVSLSGISGLNTLISGQYIRFSRGSATRMATEFIGLDQPPLTPLGTPGMHINLVTDGDYSFSKGDAIYHQGMVVGKIEDLRFDLFASKIYYNVFIESPFHELVNTDTRFWKTSGVRAELTNDGFVVEADTLSAVLLGGIAFTTPEGQSGEQAPTASTEYYIYPSRNAIYDRQFQYAIQYWIMVDANISGLNVNSRVVYRGIDIGKVLRTDYIPEGRNLLDRTLEIPILIEINPGRLGLPDTEDSLVRTTADINTWISQGLSATIISQNYLLGQKLVELEYSPTPAFSQLEYFNDIPVIPTNLDSIEKFTSSIEALIAKFNQLPIETLIADVSRVTDDATSTLQQFQILLQATQSFVSNTHESGMVEQLNATLAEIQTLAGSLSEESQTNLEVQKTLNAITELMNEFKPLVIELRNNPNSLVFPTTVQPELEPSRKQ